MMNSKLLVKKEWAKTISTKEIVLYCIFFLKSIKWKQNDNTNNQGPGLGLALSLYEYTWGLVSWFMWGIFPRYPPFPLISTIFPLQLLQGSMISKVRGPVKTSNLEFLYRDCGSLDLLTSAAGEASLNSDEAWTRHQSLSVAEYH